MKTPTAVLAAATALAGPLSAQEISQFNIGVMGGETV